MTTDALGLALTGADADAARHFDAMLRELQTYTGDPVATLMQSLEASPGFALGHVTLGWLCLTGTDTDSLQAARAALATAAPLVEGATPANRPISGRPGNGRKGAGARRRARWKT